MQKQRFDKVRDTLEPTINEMKRTRELLKKIADMAGDDEVCFRLYETCSSLEEVVGHSSDIYRDEPADLADWSCSWMNVVD
jgi:hypothetical protein